mmetsp:Transcript_8233/g.10775  ORF Transcript_8233/g.10775 Transcript_8233/m.10775 type:complete len:673 (-) Transcript_8233:162-2180(-)|eukprot:CAMPEP_0198144838 /NCGR_PEP_ID=MMETSP1443-20131203/18770_1 /TAXON_ID=186043 /ORGANISM="Entomoneis sp., Strain CCMP2396" /LENGTH=672 /DNA_ID=CAMNT_0043808307 /DNA_START=29 /DNA_END=2047 /DNA_ORIENTATION=+
MKSNLISLLLSLLLQQLQLQQQQVSGYYLPGVNPKSFIENQEVLLKVNKVTSTKTLLPLEYYRLPFCPPPDGASVDHENFGELLEGDRIENSPYVLLFKKDLYCEQVCLSNLGRGEHKGAQSNKMVKAIHNQYHNNWIVDNLNSASKLEDEDFITTRYSQGFPIGFVHETENVAYIHNHVNIEIEYHPVEKKEGKFQIVRFTVEPFSIKHDFEPLPTTGATATSADKVSPPVATIINPIPSCDPKLPQNHTDFDMVVATDRWPQEAAGKVLYTYDVIWKENKDLKWANRWDIYLQMDNVMSTKIRLVSIGRKMIIVLVLSAMVAAILTRNLNRDISRYNRVAQTDEERAEALEEYGWKLVHGDVFRPPTTLPMLLSVFAGTGAQLLSVVFPTIFFAALGFMNPARRGHLLMAQCFLFVLAGGVAGYISARIYKTFKGKSWYMNTIMTALFFPGFTFAVFFIIDIVAASQKSSDAVPFGTVALLLFLWLGLSVPLTFVGAYVGYTRDAFDFPVNTAGIPRQIPDQPFFLWYPCTVVICGIVPYGSCIVELHQVLSSMWQEHYFYVFGFLFIVFCILLITAAEITVLFNYFQLCSEDHHWWWRSFANGGGAALWVMLYAVVYFQSFESNSLATYVLYFGYMTVACLGLFLMSGFVGLYSCLWFNKTIYASVKID